MNVLHGGGLGVEQCSNPKYPGALMLADFLKCLLAKSATDGHISKQFMSMLGIQRGRYSVKKNGLASAKSAF